MTDTNAVSCPKCLYAVKTSATPDGPITLTCHREPTTLVVTPAHFCGLFVHKQTMAHFFQIQALLRRRKPEPES
jgi:hypothetical protein